MVYNTRAGDLRRIDAVLFDVDGTLVDSIPFLVECFQAAAREALECEIAVDEILPMVGLPLADMFRRVRSLDVDGLAERCAETYKRIYYPEVVARSPLFPDTREVVAHLAGLGLGLGLVSGKTREGIRRVLVPAGIAEYFDVVIGADHDGRPKPSPDGALAAAAELGSDPSRTLVVGDSLLDVEMGLAAGMFTVGVTTGTTPREALAARAHFVVDRLLDVVEIVEGWEPTPEPLA